MPRPPKAVICYDPYEEKEIGRFACINDGVREMNVLRAQITSSCKGCIIKRGAVRWKFATDRNVSFHDLQIAKRRTIKCTPKHPMLCGRRECELCFPRSIAASSFADLFCEELNFPYTALEVAANCARKMWFDHRQVCGHFYYCRPNNIVSYVKIGSVGCHYCSGRKVCGKCKDCNKRSVASTEYGRYFSDSLNAPKTASTVCISSGKKYWFDHSDLCGHLYRGIPNVMNLSHGKGYGCTYCNGTKVCGDVECLPCFENSLASEACSELYADCNVKSPYHIPKSTIDKVWFDHTGVCGHLFNKSVYDMIKAHINGLGCPYCAHMRLCEDKACAFCLDVSLASSFARKFWSDGNELTPRQVPKGSGTRSYWFRCPFYPDIHPEFQTSPAHMHAGGKCPRCREFKGEVALKRVAGELKLDLNIQKSFPGLRDKIALRYDGYLEVENVFGKTVGIVIEYDGQQHFRPINWFGGQATLDGCIRRDQIKTIYANDHDLCMLRIDDVHLFLVKEIVSEFIEVIRKLCGPAMAVTDGKKYQYLESYFNGQFLIWMSDRFIVKRTPLIFH